MVKMNLPKFLKEWKQTARQLKISVYALYLACRDPRTPWYAKVFAALVVGYALSPIDLIPDFIPVLGYLDDLVLIPLGMSIALKMIPKEIMVESRAKALELDCEDKPVSYFAGVIIALIWIALVLLVVVYAYKWVSLLKAPRGS